MSSALTSQATDGRLGRGVKNKRPSAASRPLPDQMLIYCYRTAIHSLVHCYFGGALTLPKGNASPPLQLSAERAASKPP